MIRALTLLLSCLLISPLTLSAETPCVSGTPEERLACLTRLTCPVVVTEADRSDCYRRITLQLLGAAPSAAEPEPPGPPAATPEVAAPEANPTTPAAATGPKTTATDDTIEGDVNKADLTAEFGLEWNERPAKVLDEISARIVHLETQVRGNYLMVLDNGQVWEQNIKSRTRLKEGDEVRITRGSMRSFKLIPQKSTPTNVSRIICHGDDPDPRCERLSEALLTGTH